MVLSVRPLLLLAALVIATSESAHRHVVTALASQRQEDQKLASTRRSLQQATNPDETPSIRLLRWRSMVGELKAAANEQSQSLALGDGLDIAMADPQHDPHTTSTTTNNKKRFSKALRALAAFPGLDVADPWVQRYAEAVDLYLGPWKPIEGSATGPGRGRGMVGQAMFSRVTNLPSFMSCCGHVKIIKGKIYFRYGGFLRTWYGTRRFVMTLKTIQMAITKYGLRGLTSEFLLNTCDQPISFDSGTAGLRGGYPIFSTEWMPGSVDILYPDPLDLSKSYMSKPETTVPWSKRESKAVFRGATTNYEFYEDMNWRASPRVRLHAMTDVRPDLIDARISRWSHMEPSVITRVINDGIRRGKSLHRSDLDNFKYEVVVDGGGGSSRTCGVLSSDRVMIRQQSPYMQFFQPLLKPFVHFIPTKHHFEDLFKRVEWAQAHDEEALNILHGQHQVAEKACTWEGRALYWAVLLVKYSTEAMEDNRAVEEPADVCNSPFDERIMKPWNSSADKEAVLPRKWPPLCRDVEKVEQPACTFFCEGGKLEKFRPHVWVTMESLEHIPLA